MNYNYTTKATTSNYSGVREITLFANEVYIGKLSLYDDEIVAYFSLGHRRNAGLRSSEEGMNWIKMEFSDMMDQLNAK